MLLTLLYLGLLQIMPRRIFFTHTCFALIGPGGLDDGARA